MKINRKSNSNPSMLKVVTGYLVGLADGKVVRDERTGARASINPGMLKDKYPSAKFAKVFFTKESADKYAKELETRKLNSSLTKSDLHSNNGGIYYKDKDDNLVLLKQYPPKTNLNEKIDEIVRNTEAAYQGHGKHNFVFIIKNNNKLGTYRTKKVEYVDAEKEFSDKYGDNVEVVNLVALNSDIKSDENFIFHADDKKYEVKSDTGKYQIVELSLGIPVYESTDPMDVIRKLIKVING